MLRDVVKKGVRRGLKRARSWLAPAKASPEAAKAPAPSAPSTPAPPTLDTSEVLVQAFEVLHKRSIGFEWALVDLRTVEERDRQGLIPGARVITTERLLQLRPEDIEGEAVVLVDGGGTTAAVMAATLRSQGWTSTWAIEGGAPSWKKERGPVVPQIRGLR